jgi:hypothetical protein
MTDAVFYPKTLVFKLFHSPENGKKKITAIEPQISYNQLNFIHNFRDLSGVYSGSTFVRGCWTRK